MAEDSGKHKRYTGDRENPFLKFVSELGRTVKFVRTYPEGHINIKRSAEKASEACKKAHIIAPSFSFGFSKEYLFIDEEKVKNPPVIIHELRRCFERVYLNSVVVKDGLSSEELMAFCKELAQLEQSVLSGGEIDPKEIGRRYYSHIELNLFTYEKLTQAQTKVYEKAKVAADKAGVSEEEVIDALLEKGTDKGTKPGTERIFRALVKEPARFASSMSQAIMEILTEEGTSVDEVSDRGGVITGSSRLTEKVVGVLNKISESVIAEENAGYPEVIRGLYKVIPRLLPAELQDAIFGKKRTEVSPEDYNKIIQRLPELLRARILVNDLMQRTDQPEEDFSHKVNNLTRNNGELGRITELIQKEIDRLAPGEKKAHLFARLAQTIQKDIEVSQMTRGVLIAVDTDEDVLDQYKAAFSGAGFRVLTFTDGMQALDAIQKENPVAVITEIKLPGLHGVELIRSLKYQKRNIPVLINTKYETFGSDFEIMTYPRHKFFVKPTEVPKMVTALDGFIPVREPIIQEEDRGPDMEQAREIQRGLLPQSIPDLPAYEIDCFYQACKEVGGDYYDIIALSDEKYGFIIADVAGKGIPAAMIMVLVRSTLRMFVNADMGAKDTIIKLNQLLSRDMKEGIFVSALYMVLDATRRDLAICSAGHTPAVLWTPAPDGFTTVLTKHTGVVLGLGDTQYFRDSTREQMIQMEPGVGILAYTDGVSEAMNEMREEYGEKRLLSAVGATAALSPKRINMKVIESIVNFQGSAHQRDDITLFTIKARY